MILDSKQRSETYQLVGLLRLVCEGLIVVGLLVYLGNSQLQKYAAVKKQEGVEQTLGQIKEALGSLQLNSPDDLKKEVSAYELKKRQEGYNTALNQAWDSLKNEGQFTLTMTQNGQSQQLVLIPKPAPNLGKP